MPICTTSPTDEISFMAFPSLQKKSKSVKHSVELTYAIISVKKIFPPHKNISNARTNLTLKIKAKLLEMSEAFQGGFVVDIY